MALNVVNLLATSRFAEYIDLDHFSIETGLDFDPDRFPGMTYKIENPKVCALIFRSGRIVITGAKKVEDVESALATTYQSLIAHGIPLWPQYDYEIGNVVVTHDLERELNLAHLTLSLPMARHRMGTRTISGFDLPTRRIVGSLSDIFIGQMRDYGQQFS